jgi:hypothetical protein
MKGVNGQTKGTPRFSASVIEPVVVRPGPVWVSVVRAKDGREWTVPVVSQDGAPYIPGGVGGDGWNPEPPPATAFPAIHQALRELWESDPVALWGAGFADGVRRPHQPGAHADSPEKLAVRIRRMLSDRDDDPREQRRAWTDTERDVITRARREGVYSDGALTPLGMELLESVDAAKVAVLSEIRPEATITEAVLVARLTGFSAWAIEAAIFDLEADGKVKTRLQSCDSCGDTHLSIGVCQD